MGTWWQRRRGATVARDLGLPYDGGTASRSADVVRRPLDGDDVRVRVPPGARLADGLIIDASIVARLLGLRLLTLDARIRFVPAQFTTDGPPSPPTGPAPDRTWPPPSIPWPPTNQPWPRSGGLDDAADLLADASRTLDRVKQDLTTSLRSIDEQEFRDYEGP